MRLTVGVFLTLCLACVWTSFTIWSFVLRQSGVKPTWLVFGIHADQQASKYLDKAVVMTVEDTVRYKHPDKEASLELAQGFPPGGGSLPLEKNNQAMFLSMYHQLDCIDTFGQQLTKTSKSLWPRLQHCLNFVRELAMCQPDMTVELGDFTTRNFAAERQGATHVCRDWQSIYDAVSANWDRWHDVREALRSQKQNA